jgi:hypothetical protein
LLGVDCRKPKVYELDLGLFSLVFKHDVFEFNIAVNHVPGVKVGYSAQNLLDDAGRLFLFVPKARTTVD